MTELHHFHPARKGSGSLRPFPIYPLYTQTVILSLDKPIADCFLFRPRKSCEKRRKRSHTNVSSTLSTRSSTPPAQTPQRSFRGTAAGTHLPSPTGSHTADHRAKQGPSGRGRYHYPRHVLHVHEHPRAGCQNGVLCRFWGLVMGAPKERREPSGTAMRLCASLFRGATAPLGCVILSLVFQHCVLLLSMWNSHTTQTDWYHHSRLVLHAVEPPTSGHQNGPLIVYCSVWQILY